MAFRPPISLQVRGGTTVSHRVNVLGLAVVLLMAGVGACESSSGSKTPRDGGSEVGDAGDSRAGAAGDVGDVSRDGIAKDQLGADDAMATSSDDAADGGADLRDSVGADEPLADTAEQLGDGSNQADTVDAIETRVSDLPSPFEVTLDLVGSREAASETVDLPLVLPDGSDLAVGDGRDTAGLTDGPDAPADSPLDARDSRPADTAASEAGIDGGNGPCCGCLCRDPSWSCSKDTCLDTAGHAIGLAAEAGFFELAGGSYVSESEARTSPIHRIWYSFQPAATTPASKPLVVFFNGGPGSATTAYLFSLNTAPYTFDPAVTGTAPIAANPNSWTQFANLLYIDPPGTGFSYPLALADGTQPSVCIDLDRDAGSVLRVVLRFLDRHPAVQANPVIIAGESYGGTRAVLLFDHLFRYQALTSSAAAYKDTDLYNDLVAHFAAIWPADNPATLTPSKLATQFGFQALIQPVVAGDAQWNLNTPDTSVCVSAYDGYQCNQPSGWFDQLAQTTTQHLTAIATLRQALGVDPTTIDWLYASARKKAYGRGGGTMATTPEMTSTFGALNSADNYLVILNTAVLGGYSATARTWHDASIGVSFITDLAYVNTFITNAKYDMVVWTPAVAPALRSFNGLISNAVIDGAPRTGIARPGWIEVTYVAAAIPGVTTREIRFPFYANGGHSVSLRDPANLLADVMQWYAAAPSALASAPAAAEVLRATPMVPPAIAGPDDVRYLGP